MYSRVDTSGLARVLLLAPTIILWLVALTLPAVTLAGVPGGSPERRAVAREKSAPGGPVADSSSVTVTRIRVGTHEGFTRIVLDLGGPREWSLDEPADGPVRIVLPGVQLDSRVKRLDFPKGMVRSIQPVRRSGGIEVLLVCEPTRVKVRSLALTDPDRLVLDVMLPEGAEDGQAIAQGSSVPPSARTGSKPAAEGKASAPVGLPSATEASAPSAGDPVVRIPGSQRPPAKDPTGRSESPVRPVPERQEPGTPLTVVLDPGHGGHDTGAIGPSGLMEKDVVLDLALRLRRLLQERLGLRVLMTRTEDVFVPLAERSALANRVKADFLISLHVNAANKRGAVGFETFYFSREPSDSDARASAQRENLVIETNEATGKDLEFLLKATLADMAVTRDMKESSNLAEGILTSLEKILRVENRGVKSGPFYVLATAAMPAVLVESAFITNPREERKLQREEHRQRIADALFEGIAAYKVRYEQRLGLRMRNAPSGVGS